MGTVKDRNGMDLREAEDIKKRWQEYREELCKMIFTPHNHNGVITHLEPDILESEVEWALKEGSTRATSKAMQRNRRYIIYWGQEGNIRTEMPETNS